ncbi:Ig-like domain-containing protein [Chitinimonas naiadis]
MADQQNTAAAHGTVTLLQGRAWVLDAQGQRRALQVGDEVQTGQVVITEQGSQLELGLPNGQSLDIAAGRELLVDATLLGLAPVDASEAALKLLDGSPDQVIQALNQGRDLSLELDPTAAGLSGGDASDAHGFIRLMRISEAVDSSATPSQSTSRSASDEVTPTAGNQLDPLEARDDSYTLSEDRTITVDVRSNDSNPNGGTLTIVGQPIAEHGTVLVNADGTLSYTPDADYNGTDTIRYTVRDAYGQTSNATATLTITPVNDAPIRVDGNGNPLGNTQNVQTPEDTPVSGTVLGKDVDGDTLSYSKGSDPAHGSVVVDANGNWTYVPKTDYNGNDSFTVVISDGQGGTTTVTINVGITPVNDAPILVDQNGIPVANDQHVTTPEDTPVQGKLHASDVDGDPLTFSKGSNPAHGSVSVGADGSWTYTPGQDYNGEDSFQIVVSDGQGGTTTATIHVGVTPVNDAPILIGGNGQPIAGNQSVTTAEDTPVSGSLTAHDVDGDALTFSKATDPSHGTVVVNPNGSWTYTPASNYNGSDSFQIVVSDGHGGTATATINVGITPVNDAPVGIDQILYTPEDTPLTGQLLANDADGDPLSYSLAGGPAHGTLVLNANGSWTYTPDNNYNGADSFQAVVSDGQGGTDTITIKIGVNAVPDFPTATITLDANITADDIIDATEATQNIAITGTVGGDVQVGDTVTLSVNGHSYTGTVQAGKTFSILVAGSDLAADASHSISASVTTTNSEGNSATATDTEGYTVSNAAPAPTISLNAIAGDNIVNAAEAGGTVAVSGVVGGDAKVGDTITLLINGQSYSTTVQAGNTFSVPVAGADLAAAGTHAVSATITTVDALGHSSSATANGAYTVDTTAPSNATTAITVNSITADNIVNAAEAGGNITVTGKVTGEFKAGDAVTLTVNGHDYSTTVAADGSYSTVVAGSDLAADTSIDAKVLAHDAAGNVGLVTGTHNHSVDTSASASIALNPITADNLVNASEAAGNVAVTGTVGGDVKIGDTVTLSVNGHSYTGTVQAGQTFSINVAGSDLVADAGHSITASVTTVTAAGNNATASTTGSYGVDTSLPAATITLDANITADDVINSTEAGQNIAITGTVGGDVKVGDTVTLSVNGHSYTGTVQAGLTFSINVAGSDLAADTGHSISASVTTTSANGNSTTATDTEGYSVDTVAPSNATTTITVNSITADNLVNAAEAAGNVTVTGKVTGEFKAGDTVTLTVNGHDYSTTVAADGSYTTSIAGADLAADTTIDAKILAHDAAGNVGTVTGSHTHAVDTGAAASIALDAITTDNVINSTEAGQNIAVTGTVGGDVKVGDTVTLSVNGHSYTGTVQAGNTFSINVAGSDLAADASRSISASVTTTTAVGNTATANTAGNYGVDLVAPNNATTTITVNSITADNVVNAAEAAGNVTVTGKVTGEFKAGDAVTLTINGHDYSTTVAADGTYSTVVAGSDLAADTTIDAKVLAHDAAGNVGTVTGSHTHAVDTAAPIATITLDANITADDVINSTEAGQNIAVTGTVGGDVKVGDTVTLSVNGHSYTGTVQAGNTFSIIVAGSDLAADAGHSISASVTTTNVAGNTATATDTEGYSVDTVAPSNATTTITVDSVTADNLVNAAEAAGNINVTGKVTGEFKAGDTVTLTVNGHDYSTTVAADGTYSTVVAGSDLAADTTIDAKVLAHDAAGNVGTVTGSHTHAVDTAAPIATITLDANITADDVINSTEAGQNIAVTGTVGGDVKVGDTVTLSVNGHSYTGTVQAGNTFSIIVAGSDLAADAGHSISATVTTTSANGNSTTATDTETYGIDVIAPSNATTTITVNNITADNIVNAAEANGNVTVTGKVTGEFKAGDTVTLTVNGHDYSTTVAADGSYTTSITGTDLAADTTIDAKVLAHDVAGNVGNVTGSHTHAVDTGAAASIVLNTVTADNIVNAAEAAATVAITGSVGGDVKAGDIVTLTVGSQTYSGAVLAGNTFSINVAGSDLVANAGHSITAAVSTTTAAGNTASASDTGSYGVDVIAPNNATTSISVDNITADNILNAAEAAGNVTVTGKVTGEFKTGDTVTLTVNGKDYVTTVAADGSYTTSIKGLDLMLDTSIDAKVAATDAAGNIGSATTVHNHAVDVEAPNNSTTAINVDSITADNIVNAAEAGGNITVTGKVTGEFKAGDTVTLTVNGHGYNTTVAADGSYSTVVAGSDLAADTTVDAKVLAHDAAGNVGTITSVHTHAVDVIAPSNATTSISVDNITADNIVNAAESAANITVTGKVTGEFKAGDAITLSVNGHDYHTTAAADGSYSVAVAGADLAADTSIDATVLAHDTAGNVGSANAVHNHTVDTTASARIALDVVTSDNTVNAAEAASNVAITGTVSGDVKVGDTVTLTVGSQTYSGTVQAGNVFSINVAGSDLVANGSHSITASVTTTTAAGNTATATSTGNYLVDTTAPDSATTSITVNSITADNIVNAAEAGGNITVSGTVTGEFKIGDTVTLTINGHDYSTTVAADGSYLTSVAGSDLAADTTVDAKVLAHDAAGNVGTISTVHTHAVDTLAPNNASTAITVDSITADNIVNAAEAAGNVTVTGKVTGEFKAGDAVTLTVNGHDYSTTVAADGSYSTSITGSDLAADTTIDAKVIAHDTAGNAGTISTVHTHGVDVMAPNNAGTTITVNSITADNVVNAAEAAGNVTVTGKVTGEFKAGDAVTLTVNGHDYSTTVAADGSYTTSIAGADLAADTTIDAKILAHDAAGNVGTVTGSHTHTVDTAAPIATITLDANITADDVINSTEAGQNIAITGTVGGDVKVGDTVTLSVNGHSYTGTVQAGNTFSINVAGSDLSADAGHSISASVTTTSASGNSTTATDSEGYGVDVTPPSNTTTTITVDGITADNVVNAAEAGGNVTVTGKVTGELKAGDAVTLTVNGHDYSTTVAADGTYSTVVAGSDLAADTTIDAKVLAHDAAGNVGTVTGSHTHAVDTAAPASPTTTLTVDNITADNIVNAAEAGGNITVTGKVTGEFKAGDAVTLTVNGHDYNTTVAADGSYSTSITGSDLAADTTIDAKVVAHDAVGNAGTISIVHTHAVDVLAPNNATTAITVDNVTADNILNAAEASGNVTVTGKVTGEFKAGDVVTLTVNGHDYSSAVAADGSYSTSITGADLAADTTIDAKVIAHDAAGNAGTVSTLHTHTVDTAAPSNATTAIGVDSITADNIVNAAEAAGNVTVTGKVTGEFKAGDAVTLTVNGRDYATTVAADGSYSTSIAGADLAADTTIDAKVVAHDAAGNAGTVSTVHTHAVDTTAPSNATTAISVDSITTDNIVNAAEAAGNITVTGKVTGEFKAGDAVTLTVNGHDYTTTVAADGSYSTSVTGSDLAADTTIDAKIVAHDAAGNAGTVSTVHTHAVDVLAPANPGTSIAVDSITTDNVVNAAEAGGNVTVTGKVSGEFKAGDAVTLTVNGHDYSTTVAADGSYSTSIAGSDLVADTTIDAKVIAHDTAGNAGTISTVHTHGVDITAPNGATTSITVDNITADNVLNAAEAAGNVTVTGKVTGEFKAGDAVTLTVNGHDYATTVAADGSYSTSITGADLAADTTIDAKVVAHDAAGNTGTVSTVHTHAVDVTAPSTATTSITVDNITTDNILNATEASGNVTVTGKVTGEFKAGDAVTLTVNGHDYSTTVAADGSYSTSVTGSDLAADTTIDAKVVAHDAAGNAGTVSTVHTHAVDVTAPSGATTGITVDNITTDNILNAAEAAGNITVTGKVTGEFKVGDAVTLTVNGHDYNATVAADGSYSTSVAGSDLAADTTIDAKVVAHDAAGNAGTISTVHTHAVDIVAPSNPGTSIAVDSITTDNIVNAAEAGGNITVTGKVTGEFKAGDAVTLTVNGHDYGTVVAADGSYSTSVAGSDLAADTTVDAKVLAHDAAGNAGTISTVHTHGVDTTAPSGVTTGITVDNVTADNILNTTEAAGNVTVTGKVTGEFKAGDAVTLTVNGHDYSTTVAADGSYSTSITGSDLAADTTIDAKVVAHDAVGNVGTISTVHTHAVDVTAPSGATTGITVDNITADNVLNAAEAAGNVTVTGKVTGEFKAGDAVTLTVNGHDYSTTVAADGSYSTSITGSDLAADTTIDAKVVAHDAAGNVGTISTVHTHSVDTTAPNGATTSIAVDNITADNIVNAAEASGNVTVTGKVSGEFKAGDAVTLTVNGHDYTTTVAADGSYSAIVAGSDLAVDTTIDAKAVAHDAAGNTGTISTVHSHGVDTSAPNSGTTSIGVNSITADNVLNAAEAAGNVIVTGKVTGEFKAGDTVTLTVNGANYSTTAAADGSYSVSIKGADLAADTTIDAKVLATDVAGNVGSATSVHTHGVDVTAPSNASTAIAVDNITADNVLNAAEAAGNVTVTGKVTGEFKVGDTVTLTVNGANYSATAAADGSYSVSIKGSDLAADTTIDAKVLATDAAGNVGSATSVHAHTVDTSAPNNASTTIAVDNITADNVLNAAEAAGNVTVSGKVTGEFKAGDAVTLTVNGANYNTTAAADGSYSVSIKGSDLAADTTIDAKVLATDAAGNVGSATSVHAHSVDTSAPTNATTAIAVNNITADNIVNAAEAAGNVVVTGKVTGEFKAGDAVTLTVNGANYNTTAAADGSYSVSIKGSDLVADTTIDAKVLATDAAGNTGSATSVHSHTVDTTAPSAATTAITVNNITADNIVNAAEAGGNVIVTGKVTGEFKAGDAVTLTVNGASYSTTAAADGSYSVSIKGSDLTADTSINAKVVASDAAGNTGTVTSVHNHTVDTTATATITLNSVTADNIVNASEAASTVAITGTVGGDAHAGDTVTLTVGSKSYTGTVLAGNTFSINVAGSDLVANSSHNLTASVSTADTAGNPASASTTGSYAVNDAAPVSAPVAITGTEDTAYVFSWTNFGTTDANGNTGLSIKISSLPADGVLQYNNNGTWTSVALNQTFTQTDISSGKLRFMPDANESGIDSYSTTGTGDQKQDYARFSFTATDGPNTGNSATMVIDIRPVADTPTVSKTGGSLPSTGITTPPAGNGLTLDYFTKMPNYDNNTAKDVSTLEAAMKALTPTTTSVVTSVNYDNANHNAVGTDDGIRVTGLVYLEAGKSYVFSGYRDDTFRLEIGGTVVRSDSWDSYGNYTSNTYTPTTSGYFTLEAFQYNGTGIGALSIQVSVNGSTAAALGSLPIYTGITTIDAGSGQHGSFVTVGGGGYYPAVYDQGNANSWIAISKLVPATPDTDGSETLKVSLNDLAVGLSLKDGSGHTFTATSANKSVNITGWDLTTLQVKAPTGFTGTLNMSLLTTSTETANGSTASVGTTLTVTVNSATATTPMMVASVSSVDSDSHASTLARTASTTDASHAAAVSSNDSQAHAAKPPAVAQEHNVTDAAAAHDHAAAQPITVESGKLAVTALTAAAPAHAGTDDTGTHATPAHAGTTSSALNLGGDTFKWSLGDSHANTVPAKGSEAPAASHDDKLDLRDLLQGAQGSDRDLSHHLPADTADKAGLASGADKAVQDNGNPQVNAHTQGIEHAPLQDADAASHAALIAELMKKSDLNHH